VLPLHPSMVLPPSTSRSPWLTAFWIRITLSYADPHNIPLHAVLAVYKRKASCRHL
jgi:hypothetical protein